MKSLTRDLFFISIGFLNTIWVKKRFTVQVGNAEPVSGTHGRGKPVSGTLRRGSQAAPGGAPSRGSSGRVRLISGKKRLSMYHLLRYMKRMSACGIRERTELYTIHQRRCLHCNAGLQHQSIQSTRSSSAYFRTSSIFSRAPLEECTSAADASDRAGVSPCFLFSATDSG